MNHDEIARRNLENAELNLRNAKKNERLALIVMIICVAMFVLSLLNIFRLF